MAEMMSKRERLSLNSKRWRKNNPDKYRINNAWNHMMQRCYNKNDKAYARYGGRGITVCDRWHDHMNFRKDMLRKYLKAKEEKGKVFLDRTDNDKGYSPDNCKWVTPTDSNNNRSDNRFLEWGGKKMTIPQWARHLGIKRSTLSQRYYVLGWDIEKCLTYRRA